MRLKGLIVGVVMAVVLSLSVIGLSFDIERPDMKDYEREFKQSNTFVLVDALGTAYGWVPRSSTGNYYLKKAFWEQTGSGTVIAPGYVLTAAHVIYPHVITLSQAPWVSYMTDTFRLINRTVMITGTNSVPTIATVIYEDLNADLALLHYEHKDNPWFVPVPCGFEDSNNPDEVMKQGDVLFAVTHTRSEDECNHGDMEHTLRWDWGTVVDPGPDAPYNASIAWLSPLDITMDMRIINGDSGSALFAFKGGKPVLIGVVRATFWDGITYYSYAAGLDYNILKFLITMRGR